MRALLLALTFLLAACDSNEDPVITPPPAPPELGAATYEATFTATWSAATHPTDFPANAHFSKLVGAVHPPGMPVFAVGEVATEGVRLMAEKGQNEVLRDEVRDIGDEVAYVDGPGLASAPGSVTATFRAETSFVNNTAVTLVAMVAPSPDWFVGVSGLRLIEDGAWIERAEVDLVVYDAGTDGGQSYAAADAPLEPRQPIAQSDHAYFADAPVVGTLTLTLVDVDEDGE